MIFVVFDVKAPKTRELSGSRRVLIEKIDAARARFLFRSVSSFIFFKPRDFIRSKTFICADSALVEPKGTTSATETFGVRNFLENNVSTDFSAPTQAGFSDVHVHLQDSRFGDDLPLYFERARRRGVRRFVCSGTSPADWNAVAKIARTFPDVLPTFGVHPWFVGKISGDWASALKFVLDSTVAEDGRTGAALGEIGLDFIVREKNFVEQEDAFRLQLELANERRLPIVVHSVRANARVLAILEEYPKIPTRLLHGWVATSDEIGKAVDLGAFFSFSPRSVRPNAVKARETIAAVPRDRILLESDGPNPLPPNGYANPTSSVATIAVQERGEDGALRNEPAAILDVAAAIGAVRRTSSDEFFRQLALNERRFFQFWPRRDSTNDAK